MEGDYMKVLVTGATGYIGSHVSLELGKKGYELVLVDNLINSKISVVKNLEDLLGKKLDFYQLDLLDDKFESIFKENKIDGIIHLAAYKAVGESVAKPLKYYENNISGLINLCKMMKNYRIKNFVFSSSATVYGTFNKSPMTEDMALGPINPYGNTKLMGEEILKDLYNSDENLSISLLRYFNPVGADESAKIGEDPTNPPDNIMPIITNVAKKKQEKLFVFGDDYDTPDGTCIRDYIHISDLAKGHVQTLEKKSNKPGFYIYNLGTGEGHSVLDLINTYKKVNNVEIPYEIAARRPEDIAVCFANPSKANQELDWKAEKDLESMCRDAWRWGQENR